MIRISNDIQIPELFFLNERVLGGLTTHIKREQFFEKLLKFSFL